MDPSLEESCSANDNEVLRYIHVGLLCVQDQAIDRPTMLDVIFMLKNETMSLPPPRQPAFFINLKANDQQPKFLKIKAKIFLQNDVAISTMEAR